MNRACLCCVGSCSFLAGAASGVPLLHESFESPVVTNGSGYVVYGAGAVLSTSVADWAVLADSVDLARTVSGVFAPADGAQAVDMTGSPGAGAIRTGLALDPGATYFLSFRYARNASASSPAMTAEVTTTGPEPLLRAEVTHADQYNAYRRFVGSFVADAAEATLTFTSLTGGNAGIALDDVRVFEACVGDFDRDGYATVNDLLAYLGAFRTGEPDADVSGDGSVNVNDLLAYLGAFRAGC